MEQVDVLYKASESGHGYTYYPQTSSGWWHFKHFLSNEDGGYPFAEHFPDLAWLEAAGLTHAPKEPDDDEAQKEQDKHIDYDGDRF